jgi:uncharacterized membrane protein YidH (DUF202 family)
MRTLARTLINLALLAGTLAAMYWAMTQPSWRHASPRTHDVIIVAIAVAGFVLACLALKAVPAKRKPAPRPSFTPAAPVRRGR